MSSQHQNKGSPGGNVPSNAGPSMEFSLAGLATAPLGPSHDPLAEWAANVSRRDNPISDFQFEFLGVEKPAQKTTTQKKATQKKTIQKNSTQKKTAHGKPKAT